MSERIGEGGDLDRLMDGLCGAVVALDELGAERYSDLHLSVRGFRGGDVVADVTMRNGRLAIHGTPVGSADLLWRTETEQGDEGSLLRGDVGLALWRWAWRDEEAAVWAGCSCADLRDWLAHPAGDGSGAVPGPVERRLRQIVVLDQQRRVAGISDESVSGWMRASRAGFGNRSALEVLAQGDEVGHLRILLWLLNVGSAGETVH